MLNPGRTISWHCKQGLSSQVKTCVQPAFIYYVKDLLFILKNPQSFQLHSNLNSTKLPMCEWSSHCSSSSQTQQSTFQPSDTVDCHWHGHLALLPVNVAGHKFTISTHGKITDGLSRRSHCAGIQNMSRVVVNGDRAERSSLLRKGPHMEHK